MSRQNRLAAAVVALVFLVICDAPEAPPAGTASPTRSPSGASFVNGGECGPATDSSLPSAAGCVSTVSAGGETLTVYASLDGDNRPRRWRIRLAGPEADIDQPLPLGNAFSYPRVLGATDIDDDGTTEWWLKAVDYTSHGAPWSGARLYVAAGNRLVPVTTPDGPLVVNYGGIARLGEGARCDGARLVLLRAEAQNVRNTKWATSERVFVFDGGEASLHRRTGGRLEISDYNDPDLDPFYAIACDGFEFPP